MSLSNGQSRPRPLLLAVLFASLVVMSGINAALAGSTHKLKVDGLACPYCSYGIEKHLSGLAGVKSVRVSVGSGTVTVIMKDGATLSRAAAARAVANAGFTMRSFR